MLKKAIIVLVLVLTILTSIWHFFGKFYDWKNDNIPIKENVSTGSIKEQKNIQKNPLESTKKNVNNVSKIMQITSTGSVEISNWIINENTWSLIFEKVQKELDSIDLVLYDWRKNKKRAKDVQDFLKNRYWLKISWIDTIANYDTTFISWKDKRGIEIVKKWFPWIYENQIDLPKWLTAIVIWDNWETVLPKLLNEWFKNNK